MGLNVREGSTRKKKQKHSQPEDSMPSEKKASVKESGRTPRKDVQGLTNDGCPVEVDEAAGENPLEPIAAKRLLLAHSKDQKPCGKESIEGDSGLPSPGGDPAMPALGKSRPCRSGPSDRWDSDDSSSEASTGTSSKTGTSSSYTGSDEDSDDVISESSHSGAEEPAAPPGPDNTTSDSNIQKELSGMSFEELLQLQNKVGTKLYNQMAYGSKAGQSTAENAEKKPRLNKNRPMEISAKKPVPFLRQVVPVKKKVHRDPRFDDLSGEYKPEIFEKTYSFINDIKKKEKQNIEQSLRKVKSADQKQKMQSFLQRLEHQEKAEQARQRQRERDLEFKKKQRELAKEGKKPFYLKKSEKRTLELADKYKDLKKSGKLENFLSKKRKRNAGKDRRRLPFRKDW
ncbi:ribosomal RNA processing protein 36 homolog [Ambystoma mexicanum]|uniref:ribosomal RNA processing protein 36 homolog n=1 Tax=Ambystoma mexicanum TaxID=8296 RepID=UPI0037E8529C